MMGSRVEVLYYLQVRVVFDATVKHELMGVVKLLSGYFLVGLPATLPLGNISPPEESSLDKPI